jgi:5-formyltetrahydrofolate cyclo-ligase
MIDKKILRAELRARRDAHVAGLDADALAHAVAGVTRAIEGLDRPRGGYVAVGSEFPLPLDLVDALPFVANRGAPMAFRRWTSGGVLEAGWAGLSHPAVAETVTPSVILAPLLGFDRKLGRIGQGAGFYDRWFAAHPQALRIGIAWACQEADAIPADPWDMPLQAVITEKEWIGPPP